MGEQDKRVAKTTQKKKPATAKQRRLPTGQLGEIGESLVILQLLARGATVAYKLPLGAPADDLIVHLEDGRDLRLQVKTRRTGDWQPHYKESFADPDPKTTKTRFWVFVDLKAIDLGQEAPHFYIIPAVWIEDYIHRRLTANLKRRGITLEQRRSRHTKIQASEIKDWRNRWDLLGLSQPARF
jgi:hypothetical protein